MDILNLDQRSFGDQRSLIVIDIGDWTMSKFNLEKIMKRRLKKNAILNTAVLARSFAPDFSREKNDQPEVFIKFKNGDLSQLRQKVLKDLSKEQFAFMFGKSETIGKYRFIKVVEIKFAEYADFVDQSVAFLRLKKDFVYKLLVEMQKRFDVDTIIDVHTHPFAKDSTGFSGTDDRDEFNFLKFVDDKSDNRHYASIVFSQNRYSARFWQKKDGKISFKSALIKTQTVSENIPSCDFDNVDKSDEVNRQQDKTAMFNRGVLALGLNSMRQIMTNQTITIVGAGGLGSVVAEHLVHMGFNQINLIDHDQVEVSNLNRIVGAYYLDAMAAKNKVDVIKNHLERINPQVKVKAFCNDIHDKEIEEAIALSDWIIMATDNHSSRFRAQNLAFQYFIPFMSAGVNISVNDGLITDMSGEVVTVRMGDRVCLNCLNRINLIKVGQETHFDEMVSRELVSRGYVSGKDIKEPAVKTLNTNLATLAVDILINQYTQRQRTVPIVVYENNLFPSIYEDKESVKNRELDCFTCGI